jgi:hypothetical protein
VYIYGYSTPTNQESYGAMVLLDSSYGGEPTIGNPPTPPLICNQNKEINKTRNNNLFNTANKMKQPK